MSKHIQLKGTSSWIFTLFISRTEINTTLLLVHLLPSSVLEFTDLFYLKLSIASETGWENRSVGLKGLSEAQHMEKTRKKENRKK